MNRKKDFYTNKWMTADMVAFILAAVLGSLVGSLVSMGVIYVAGLEDFQASGLKGVVVIIGFLVVMATSALLAAVGLIAIYDMAVEWRWGRKRGLLKRALSYVPRGQV